ncbi:MAG: hypothetical protein E6J72_09210 [Deltaproteobacteria bacterium]|nr:MAG: hypothetical protein E6J72_09210 [Deltaproteobacteria bacterium]
MRTLTIVMIPALVLAGVSTAAALDCARVKALNAEGKRASDIARALGITTPDVQACLAGEVDDTSKTRTQRPDTQVNAPTLPSSDSPIPRPPGQ